MNIRRILLRVILISLAVAAVMGVMVVLVSAAEAVGRIVGSAAVTAAAAALLMPFSFLADSKNWRRAGMLGMMLILSQYLMGIAAIWAPDIHALFYSGFGGDMGEQLAATIAALIPTGALAMICLRYMTTPNRRIGCMVGFVTAGGTLVTWLIAIWLPVATAYGSYRFYHWPETGFLIGVYGLLAAGAALGVTPQPRTMWRLGGAVAAVLGLVMGLYGVWAELNKDSTAFVVITSIAVCAALVNPLLLASLTGPTWWVRLATIALVILTAVFVNLGVSLNMFWDQFGPFPRLASASGIISVCGLMATAVLMRFHRLPDYVNDGKDGSVLLEMLLFCPRCRRKQKLAIGDAVCSGCGLRIHTRVEEPRCAKCGYLLYMLRSDRCPECGTPVSQPGSLLAGGSTSPTATV